MMKNRIGIVLAVVAVFFAAGCGQLTDLQEKAKHLDKTMTTESVSVEEARIIIEANNGNADFVLLDVRTNAEYNEGHLHNAQQHDYYAADIRTYLSSLDKEKRYLIYCRTDNRSEKAFKLLQQAGFKYIQYVKGGFTEWANKGYPVEKPQYEKVLDILVTADKVKAAQHITFYFTVTDLDGNPIRKADLTVCVMRGSAKVTEESVTADDTGKGSYTFTAAGAAHGAYRLIVHAEKNAYQSAQAYYDFAVAAHDEQVTAAPDDIRREADVTEQLVEKFYNRNIYGYTVYNCNREAVPLGNAVQPDKPVLLMFISPTCAGCMVKAQELTGYDLSSITVIPLITSVNDDIAQGIRETEAALQELGLAALIPQTHYDSKDKIWFSRFKFQTTPKFILINTAGQIKDIIHGSEQVKTADIIKKIERIFRLPALINRAEILRQLAVFEKGDSLKLKDGQSTLLADLTSLELIRQKLAFDYSGYRLVLESFSPDTQTNTLLLTYHIESEQAPQHKTKSITSRLSGFKSTAQSLAEETAEMNRILEKYRYFKTSNIAHILLEEFSAAHILHECTQYGYSLYILAIDKNTAANTATVRYYIYKISNPEVRTEERTQTFSGFAKPNPQEKPLRDMLKRFKTIPINSLDKENTLRLLNKSMADSTIEPYLSDEQKKISAITAGKPSLIGIGFVGCPTCEWSWQTIANRLQNKPDFAVIELLYYRPTQESFFDTLKKRGIETLKDEFYLYSSFPSECKPQINGGVPVFMVADKHGRIVAVPKRLETAFQMLNVLAQEQ